MSDRMSDGMLEATLGASVRPAKLGDPINRVDGRLKVTGGAKYAAELPITNPAYAVLVTSTIARGRVRNAVSPSLS